MSTLEVSNLNDGTTTVETTYITNGSAKAWLNMNGSGTIVINDSLNITSLVDNNTGQYEANFVNSTANINYAVTSSNIGDTQSLYACSVQSIGVANTVSKYEFSCRNTVTDAMINSTVVNTVTHGDLA